MKSTQHYLSHDCFENFEYCLEFQPEYEGKYDIPVMEPCYLDVSEDDRLLRFCDWKSVNDPENYITHFYYDDYKFIQAWRKPEKYLDRLSRFKAVIAPEFSLYTDFPKTLQILSCYRRQWLAAYWQYNGIEVIPCVLWGDEDSYDFCFDGIPCNGVVSVSTVGIKRKPNWNGRQYDLFKRGYDEMLIRIAPDTILWNGPMVDGIDSDRVIKLPSYYDERRPYLDELKAVKRRNGNRK